MEVHWLEQVAGDLPAGNDWLCAGEQARLSALHIPKRRADWRLGRWTAKHAVAARLRLDTQLQTLASIEIRPTELGAPEAFVADKPAPVSISLSHRADVAACAVAPSGGMLGCDLELIEPRSDAFLADYFTASEQELVARASAADRDRVANLLWSAKESALKALGMGLRLDSHCAIVTSVGGLSYRDQDGEQDRLICVEERAVASQSEASLWHPMRVTYTGGREFHGWWWQTGLLVRTMVASPSPKQPVILTL